MVLVAIAMVAIIAMAALSIDVITLYLAREEAQRSADAGALAAARTISIWGITGDPSNQTGNWQLICGGGASSTTLVAQAVAQQNAVGGIAAGSITVTYSAGGAARRPTVPGCQPRRRESDGHSTGEHVRTFPRFSPACGETRETA
jgi:Putative Flp pilus-assembly TadE/G-like